MWPGASDPNGALPRPRLSAACACQAAGCLGVRSSSMYTSAVAYGISAGSGAYRKPSCSYSPSAVPRREFETSTTCRAPRLFRVVEASIYQLPPDTAARALGPPPVWPPRTPRARGVQRHMCRRPPHPPGPRRLAAECQNLPLRIGQVKFVSRLQEVIGCQPRPIERVEGCAVLRAKGVNQYSHAGSPAIRVRPNENRG